MAALRRGGSPVLPFKSARPAAVTPNRALAAVHFARYSGRFTLFYFQQGYPLLNSI